VELYSLQLGLLPSQLHHFISLPFWLAVRHAASGHSHNFTVLLDRLIRRFSEYMTRLQQEVATALPPPHASHGGSPASPAGVGAASLELCNLFFIVESALLALVQNVSQEHLSGILSSEPGLCAPFVHSLRSQIAAAQTASHVPSSSSTCACAS